MRVAVALLCAAAIVGAAAIDAVVRMHPATAQTSGLVTFTATATGAYDIAFNVQGFAANTVHGVHIHEFGDISAPDGTAAGAHFNPYGAPHACPNVDPRHVGDLGNVTSDASGNIIGTITTDLRLAGQSLNLTFDGSANFVNANPVGRGLIIHNAFDDCVTQTTGNSGARLSQGVIGVALNANAVGSEYSGWAALYAKVYDPSGAVIGDVWIRNTTANGVGIEVYAQITGVAPGSVHGLHLHQYGDHTLYSAANAGSHFNPYGGSHGLPYEATNTHMGDLGNVIADNNGTIIHHANYSAVNFNGGIPNIIGRAVVLHAYPDQGRQYTVDQTGGAGYRVGMGVLGLANANRFPADPTVMSRSGAIVGYAKLFGTSNRNGASGFVKIVHGDDNLAAVQVSLQGLDSNKAYAIHVHEFGDLTLATGLSAGAHYNPFGWAHACFPATGRRHVGDIGNLPNTTGSGTVDVTLYRDWIALTGENSTIGRAIIVHQTADDCQTQTTGNAGSRYLHGVIGQVAAPTGNTKGSSSNPGPKTPLVALMARVAATSNADSQLLSGTVYITMSSSDPTATLVYVNIQNAPVNSTHGFHVHEFADWQDGTGNGAGGHWNPLGYTHATPSQANLRHAGDLGNVVADAQGSIVTTITVYNLPIQNIAGKAVVLHHDEDIGNRSPADNGHAGTRIAMGVLGIMNPTTVIPVPPPANTTVDSSTGGCPADQICAGSMATPSVAALIAGALLLAVVRRD